VKRLSVAIVWPKPRRHRWQLGRLEPEAYPDLSDGLLFLEQEGFDVAIEESCPRLLNPLVGMHEFYSGLDPVRAARVLAHFRRYDALVCIGEATAFVLIALMRLLRMRLPIILIDPALSDGYARRKRLQDYVLPRVDRVVVYGRVQEAYLQKEYGVSVRSTFLHHRADVEFYKPEPAEVAEGTVFSIGNDVSRDFETLAAAARLCAPRHLRFLVQTSRSIADATGLELTGGHLPYADLRRAYARAAVVAVPLHDSRHAGGINALLEAMAMGKAIVVSGSSGIADYVDAGQSAEVVPPGDPAALAAAITAVAGDRERTLRLGQAARQLVLDRCDNRRYAQKLGAVIREAVAVGRAGVAPRP
jgi:glycosyltransferase involved in cell wall biosynthesis